MGTCGAEAFGCGVEEILREIDPREVLETATMQRKQVPSRSAPKIEKRQISWWGDQREQIRDILGRLRIVSVRIQSQVVGSETALIPLHAMPCSFL